MSALDLIRPDLASLESYVASDEQPDCRLHVNELPWSPIDAASIALNRYPERAPQKQLQSRLARLYQIESDALLLTRGSDEGIDLLMRLFLRAGVDSMMQCPPTFPMYAFYARLQQAKVIECPLNDEMGFGLNLELIREQWQPNCKLIMLCRPNNPTGNLITLETIVSLCTQYHNQSVIVVDEAYIEFSNQPSASCLINQFDNLIVLRTLSKAYGLAGLRVGAMLAQPIMIEALRKIVAPFTFSSAVIDLSLRALQDAAWFDRAIQQMTTLKQQLMDGLQASSWVDVVYSSAANFILIKTRYSAALFLFFRQHGIAIRQFSESVMVPASKARSCEQSSNSLSKHAETMTDAQCSIGPLTHHLRITVGNDLQNKRLLAVLASFAGEI